MKTQISQKLKWGKILSIVTIVLGVVLLVFMITVEDEPGALPLFLILSGTIFFLINRYQIKKNQNNKHL